MRNEQIAAVQGSFFPGLVLNAPSRWRSAVPVTAPLFLGIPTMNQKTLIYTEATGIYKDYAELWKFCINTSYPEYDVKVRFPAQDKESPIYYAACNRYLVDQPAEYDYVYVTDIDMMILREDPTLLSFHLEEMLRDNLCYSNTPRKREQLGAHRLTGLHFASRGWYEKTVSIRDKYRHMLNNGEIGNSRFDDELMLMQICKKSGLDIPQKKGLISRHHGIHMGTLRAYVNHPYQQQRKQLMMRVKAGHARQWVELADMAEFKKIVTQITTKAIKDELNQLYSFCRSITNV